MRAYTVLDFSGYTLSTVETQIDGIFERVEECVNQNPIMITGIPGIAAQYVVPTYSNTFWNFTLIAATNKTLAIGDDDLVTLN